MKRHRDAGTLVSAEASAGDGVCRLRVCIDYEAPARGLGRRTPRLAAFYARWCVQKMVGDVARHFGRSARA